ncbi:MAG: DNA starvation/stationary phase protection protein [Alphaproteobacteria bacterium CG_4_10_14_0_8_um_filter_37_21]|nr:MAG: DNA starvation/stationary phase protection protein [Alphaproteobacteria bacterium CG_4_10_14_0_8_um_filter_37_21]
MTDNKITDALQIVLADNYALYLKTQNYHWNVTGANFRSLHLLFEEQYTDLFTANDDIAERIRTLGSKVPATLGIFASVTNIEDGNENADAQTMVKELADDQAKILKSLTNALHAAQKAQDEATIDFIINRIGVHEKAAWILRSSLL